ncbi:MAG: efflux RND transporter periplasmic adaptor subunit [Pseudolabrys sp.]
MRRLKAVALFALGLSAGVAGGYWYAHPRTGVSLSDVAVASNVAAAEHKIVYYRDPSGAPYWSAKPKKDASGRDYVAVYEDEVPVFGPGGELKKAAPVPATSRTVRYYRNPMGLPDTSPVPKKDSMGMDYIPVYDGDDKDGGTTVKVSLDKVQRSGVKTELVEERTIIRPVRGVGTIKYDERSLTVVTMRATGYIEELFVNATGQTVRAGDPLFRIYSSDIQLAQADLIVAAGVKAAPLPAESYRPVEGTMQRLRNLGVPESRIQEVRTNGKNLRTIDWPSPATGTVIEKRVVNGQQVTAGAELYRIADLSRVWVIAEVAESDLASIKIGTPALITLRAYPSAPIKGDVAFIYPDLKPETRTARVRIELPNPDDLLKVDMYADVVFQPGADQTPVVAVPTSALIDSGSRQIVLIAKGEGRFEPRPVKIGRRGDGYIEVADGVRKGEEVVTSATFLIDAESNLRAALQAFTQPETSK